jgi:hypothetical protein
VPVSDTELHAVFDVLRFRSPKPDRLKAIPESRWAGLLAFADRAQLTLALGLRAGDALPPAVRARIANDLANNELRHQRLLQSHRDIKTALDAAGIPFLVLKGITYWPGYCARPEHRPQSDIDIFCPPEACEQARFVLQRIGWTPILTMRWDSTDHLPVMIRKTGWAWKGDYFDPDMPHALEIHFRLWDPKIEAIAVEDIDGLVASADVRDFNGLGICALRPSDCLTYACLHLVKHLLGGGLIPRHAYEIAHFLEYSTDDDAFWQAWREEQDKTPRRRLLAGIAFRLAIGWFDCAAHPVAVAAAGALPRPVAQWFDLFLWSPAAALLRPNKDEMWLQIALSNSESVRMRTFFNRMFPQYIPRPLLDAHLPPENTSLALRSRRFAYAAAFTAQRAMHHVRAVFPVLASGIRYWRALRSHA